MLNVLRNGRTAHRDYHCSLALYVVSRHRRSVRVTTTEDAARLAEIQGCACTGLNPSERGTTCGEPSVPGSPYCADCITGRCQVFRLGGLAALEAHDANTTPAPQETPKETQQ